MKTQPAAAGLDRIEQEVTALGLVVFGGFWSDPADRVPALPDGRAAASVLMIGNASPAAWAQFSAAPEAGDGAPDPMDRWCRRALSRLAARFDGAAIFPSDGPPYPPFVAWAKRAAPVRESPIGMLIHPVYGLWHAYRGALALPERLPLPPAASGAYPCDGCQDKPCLTACPVSAFGPEGYDVSACAAHIEAPAGVDCLALGCRARRACPIGREFVYDPPQAAFHMTAFLAARRGRDTDPGTGRRTMMDER